jgi:hypothetical protein
MTMFKGNNNNKCWQGWGETLIHCYWECKLVQQLLKAVQRFLKKLKTELPHNPVILILEHKEHKIGYSRDTCTLVFIALFKMDKLWKQPRSPTSVE